MCPYVPTETLEENILALSLAHNPYKTQLAVHEMGILSHPYFLEVLQRKPHLVRFRSVEAVQLYGKGGRLMY